MTKTPEQHVRDEGGTVLSDGDGGFYGMLGKHTPGELFRAICNQEGLCLADLGIESLSGYRSAWAEVKQGMSVYIDQEDDSTWGDDEIGAMEDGYWPSEWDQFYKQDDKGSIPMTYWMPM